MGKAKWWVCDSCKSLNDLPANKCYKCRVPKPGNPTMFDDQYTAVSEGQQRVGVSVDLSKVGDLTSPDPVETAAGGGVMEAFDQTDDPNGDVDAGQPTQPRYDANAGGFATPATPAQPAQPNRPAQPNASPQPTTPVIRDPIPRGIDAVGGRQWTFEPAVPEDGPDDQPPNQPPPAAPPPAREAPKDE